MEEGSLPYPLELHSALGPSGFGPVPTVLQQIDATVHKAEKHSMSITYSWHDNETTMVLNTALNA